MKNSRALLIGAAGLAAAVLTAAPVHASQDIPWTWNSGDHDAKANFIAYGEVHHAYEYAGNTYVDWGGPNGSGRWWIAGTGVERTLNFDWPEGKTVTLKVCQQHTAFPDDCSATKYGVS